MYYLSGNPNIRVTVDPPNIRVSGKPKTGSRNNTLVLGVSVSTKKKYPVGQNERMTVPGRKYILTCLVEEKNDSDLLQMVY